MIFLGEAMHKIIKSHDSGGLGRGDYLILAIVMIWIKGGASLLLFHNNSYSIHSMSKKAQNRIYKILDENPQSSMDQTHFFTRKMQSFSIINHLKSCFFQEFENKTSKVSSQMQKLDISSGLLSETGMGKDGIIDKKGKIIQTYAMVPLIELPMKTGEGRVSLSQCKPSSIRNYSLSFMYDLCGDEVASWQQSQQSKWRQLQGLEFYKAGNYFRRIHKYQLAIRCFENAINSSVLLYQAFSNLAQIYYLFGLQEKALEILNRSALHHPRNYTLINNIALQFSKKEPKKAIQLLETSLSIKPNVISYNNIGLLYLQTGFLKEALSSFDLALEMRLNFHSLIGRGVTLTLLARFQDAISCFEEISAEGEEKKILLTNQGHAYYEAGLIDSACSCFQRGAKLFPGEPHFYNGMAMIAFELGTMTQSFQLFKRATTSKKAIFHSNYVVFLIKINKIEQALDQLQLILKRDDLEGEINILQIVDLLATAVSQEKIMELVNSFLPQQKIETQKVLNKKACILSNMCLYEAALEELIKALQIKKEPIVLLNIGFIFYSLNKLPMAFYCFQQCLALNEHFASPYYYLGYFMVKFKQYEDSKKIFKRYLELIPNNIKGLNAIGVVEYLLNNQTQAMKYFDQALEISPSYRYSLNNKAILLNKTSRLISVDYYLQVSNIWTEPEIFFNKGVVMEERGNTKQAKRLYSLALDIRPSFPQALHNLGFLYLRMKVSEGFSYLRRAILQAPSFFKSYIIYAIHFKLKNEKNLNKFIQLIKQRQDSSFRVQFNIAVMLKIFEMKEEYAQCFQKTFLKVVKSDQTQQIKEAVSFSLELFSYLQETFRVYQNKWQENMWNIFLLIISYLFKLIGQEVKSRQYLQDYLSSFKKEDEKYRQKTVPAIIEEISEFTIQTQQILSGHVGEYLSEILPIEGMNYLSGVLNQLPLKSFVSQSIMRRYINHQQDSESSVNGSEMELQFSNLPQTHQAVQNYEKDVKTNASQPIQQQVTLLSSHFYSDIPTKRPRTQIQQYDSLAEIHPEILQKRLPYTDRFYSPEDFFLEKIEEKQHKPRRFRQMIKKKISLCLSPSDKDINTQFLEKLIFFNKIEAIKQLSSISSDRFARHFCSDSLETTRSSLLDSRCTSLLDFVYTTESTDCQPLECFTHQTGEVMEKEEAFHLMTDICSIFMELEHHQIHHLSVDFQHLSKIGSKYVCSCFEEVYIILQKGGENEQIVSECVNLTKTLLTFWFTIQSSHFGDETVFKTIFKGLPQSVLQQLRQMKQLSLAEVMISPSKFKQKLEEIQTYAVKAMKIDHWNQFQKIINHIINLQVKSEEISCHDSLSTADACRIKEIMERLNVWTEPYSTFKEELKLFEMEEQSLWLQICQFSQKGEKDDCKQK